MRKRISGWREFVSAYPLEIRWPPHKRQVAWLCAVILIVNLQNIAVPQVLWHNAVIKRVDGNEYIRKTAREPAVGVKRASEADGKSSRSGEPKLVT